MIIFLALRAWSGQGAEEPESGAVSVEKEETDRAFLTGSVFGAGGTLQDMPTKEEMPEEIWFAPERRRRWPCARHLIRENI